MDESKSKTIADAWLNFQRNWWAWDKLDELCRKDPKGAWSVLTELVELADSKELLEDIGVGPLEDFINYHVSDYIAEIETAASASDALSEALSHAQLRDANDPAAARIGALGCRIASSVKQADAFDDPP